MSTFSFPERPAPEIIAVLAQTGIAALKPEDLQNPNSDLVADLYSSFLAFVNPLSEDSDSQIAFGELELLENPDHHVDAIRIFNLYRRVKNMLLSIRFSSFGLGDLIMPEPKRTLQILSTIVNFIFYREDKLNMLQPIVDELPGYEEQRMNLESMINEFNKQILDHEVACQMEQPLVQQLEAEVKELQQTIRKYNEQQLSLKTMYQSLKEKSDAIGKKISQADYELDQNAQKNSRLSLKIVQSPDKLQKALEEKKLHRTEVKNSEKLVMQSVKEKNSTQEVLTKVQEKLHKHLSRMQAIQEQVNSSKALEKDVKALKAKLSDEGVSIVALEAKIFESQTKVEEAEEMVKAAENDRDIKNASETQKLNTTKAEIEWKLRCLEPREKEVEAIVAKADGLHIEAGLAKETGKAQTQMILDKFEEIVKEFQNYSNMMNSILEKYETPAEIHLPD